jgi:hypothetical protein
VFSITSLHSGRPAAVQVNVLGPSWFCALDQNSALSSVGWDPSRSTEPGGVQPGLLGLSSPLSSSSRSLFSVRVGGGGVA